jgi:hypothetical protein
MQGSGHFFSTKKKKNNEIKELTNWSISFTRVPVMVKASTDPDRNATRT